MLPRFILLFILVIVTPAVSKSARGISKISIKNKAFVTPGYQWAPSKKMSANLIQSFGQL